MSVRALFLGAALIFAVGCNNDDDTTDTDTDTDTDVSRADDIAALTGDVTAGETAFGTNCAGCHGADATGVTGPDLTASTLGVAEAAQVIIDGRNGMPEFSAQADQDIADMIAWYMSL